GSSPHAFSLSLFSDLCLGWARAKTRTLCFRESARRPKARPATTSGLERTPCNRIAEQTFSGSLHSALQCLFGGRSLWRSGRDDRRKRDFSNPATTGLIALVGRAACACEGHAYAQEHTTATKPHSFTVDGDHFALDGKPFKVLSGELHYARMPREY